MNTVRVSIKMTSNIPSQTDLFVEVDDISQPAWRPLAAFHKGGGEVVTGRRLYLRRRNKWSL